MPLHPRRPHQAFYRFLGCRPGWRQNCGGCVIGHCTSTRSPPYLCYLASAAPLPCLALPWGLLALLLVWLGLVWFRVAGCTCVLCLLLRTWCPHQALPPLGSLAAASSWLAGLLLSFGASLLSSARSWEAGPFDNTGGIHGRPLNRLMITISTMAVRVQLQSLFSPIELLGVEACVKCLQSSVSPTLAVEKWMQGGLLRGWGPCKMLTLWTPLCQGRV